MAAACGRGAVLDAPPEEKPDHEVRSRSLMLLDCRSGVIRDPLKAFVESLDRVAGIEGIEKVLPAHGHPFTDLPARVEDIKGHHMERLDKLRAVAGSIGAATVEEFSHHLFRKARWGPMASSETYAHLEHLRLMGDAERREENGTLLYEVAPPPTS